MNGRLKIILTGGLIALASLYGAGASAQSNPNAEPGPPAGGRMHREPMTADQILQRMSEKLDLTEDQKNQIKPILEERQKQMESLRSDSSTSPEDRRSKMRSMAQESNNKIRALLNDDQKKKFDDMHYHRAEGRPGRPGSQGQMQ